MLLFCPLPRFSGGGILRETLYRICRSSGSKVHQVKETWFRFVLRVDSPLPLSPLRVKRGLKKKKEIRSPLYAQRREGGRAKLRPGESTLQAALTQMHGFTPAKRFKQEFKNHKIKWI